MPLSPQWRRALEMLAEAGWRGATEAELLGQGFSTEMISSLVLSGRTVATVDMKAGCDYATKVLRITNAGRQEIEGKERPAIVPRSKRRLKKSKPTRID
jgi:hypothetical protein